MFSDVLEKVKGKGLSSKKLSDKNSSTNAIFCDDCIITYCSNHCKKNTHKDFDGSTRTVYLTALSI